MKSTTFMPGHAMQLVIQTWGKGEKKQIKGILLEEKEEVVVFKPITTDERFVQQLEDSHYDQYEPISYKKKHIVSAEEYVFPEEVLPHIKAYYDMYQKQVILKKQIQTLQDQLKSAEEGRKEACENIYETYFPHVSNGENYFLMEYFQQALTKVWKEEAWLSTTSGPKRDENDIYLRKPTVTKRDNQILVTFWFQKRYEHIKEVPSCRYEEDLCNCHTKGNRENFFEKYSHPFGTFGLRPLPVEREDFVMAENDLPNTPYWIRNKIVVTFTPDTNQNEKTLSLLLEFIRQFAS